ncbi:hypothetical protein [Putridiphycobacter roseus]|uniref:hypothetical protein n=1 Tax=Putridiphycobacter roseus TaxID=2219161 RepID=UPI0013147FFF|nr:hypothetical protein [Putridiphycobacter roseus]
MAKCYTLQKPQTDKVKMAVSPKNETLANILNFSKAYEVKQSINHCIIELVLN